MKYATPSMIFPRITRKDNLITDEIMTNNYLSVFERVLDDDPLVSLICSLPPRSIEYNPNFVINLKKSLI